MGGKKQGEGGDRGGEREINLEERDNGIIRQNTDVEIQVPQGGPILFAFQRFGYQLKAN